MPKGHMDVDRQLDALAHVIVKDDIGAVAAEWGITRNGVYKLAHSALMRLQRAMYSWDVPVGREDAPSREMAFAYPAAF
jgi:hypothetical protein